VDQLVVQLREVVEARVDQQEEALEVEVVGQEGPLVVVLDPLEQVQSVKMEKLSVQRGQSMDYAKIQKLHHIWL